MRRVLGAVLVTIVTAAPSLAQTAADGEITGRITDASATPLPGVRVVIQADDERREAITDKDGRFAHRGLKLGTYRVTAELPGFTTLSGTITLAPTIRRAHIAWPLTVGCVEQDILVIPSARDAAAYADTIAHVRIRSNDGQVRVSTHPACSGLSRLYTVEIVNATVRRGLGDDGRPTVRFGRHADDLQLQVGGDYLAILWPAELGTGGLLFPIVAGRVTSPTEEALHGMRIEEALKTLTQWSRERPR